MVGIQVIEIYFEWKSFRAERAKLKNLGVKVKIRRAIRYIKEKKHFLLYKLRGVNHFKNRCERIFLFWQWLFWLFTGFFYWLFDFIMIFLNFSVWLSSWLFFMTFCFSFLTFRLFQNANETFSSDLPLEKNNTFIWK